MLLFFSCYCVYFTSSLCSATASVQMLVSFASLVFINDIIFISSLAHHFTGVCAQMAPLHFPVCVNGNGLHQSIIYMYTRIPCTFFLDIIVYARTRLSNYFCTGAFVEKNTVELANREVQFCLVGFALSACVLHSRCFYAIIPKW